MDLKLLQNKKGPSFLQKLMKEVGALSVLYEDASDTLSVMCHFSNFDMDWLPIMPVAHLGGLPITLWSA